MCNSSWKKIICAGIRWDSLGEFLALAVSLEELGIRTGNNQAKTLAKSLTDNEQTIVAELSAVQGTPVDIGGYYKADEAKVVAVMRPSKTLNAVLAAAA